MKTVFKHLFLVMLVGLICIACKKPEEEIVDVNNNDSDTTNSWRIIWQKSVFEDITFVWNLPMTIRGDQLIYSSKAYGGADNPPDGLLIFDKYTGDKYYAWGNQPSGFGSENVSINNYTLSSDNNDIVFICTDRCIYAFHLTTAIRRWKKMYQSSATDGWVTSFNEDALMSYSKSDGNSPHWTQMAILSKETGSERKIYKIVADSVADEVVYFMPANYFVNANLDTLLYFSSSFWNFDQNVGRMELYCYNLTQNRMEWTKQDFADDPDAGRFLPHFTSSGNVIYHCQQSIHCVDMETGEFVWQREYPGEFFQYTEFLHLDDKMYCLTNMGKLYCLDEATGNVIWTAKGYYPPNKYGYMDYYKGNLYLIGNPGFSGELFKFSLETGELLARDVVSDENLKGGVTIDHETGYAYVEGVYSVICLDIDLE